MPDPLILGQYHPSFFPYGRQPFTVLGTYREVIIMDFDGSACLAKGLRNDMSAKIPIQKKGQRIRLLLI